ncbi:MAG: hypothetical protein H6Q42_3080, partial [Deltaproteobacteria bacterium]|nr:hypothetical protein [Deltaproteobacteria bacterium]
MCSSDRHQVTLETIRRETMAIAAYIFIETKQGKAKTICRQVG